MESNFIDFFAICGLDTSSTLELEHFTSKISEYATRPPLERSYVAKLLAHYPSSRFDMSFSQEILALCLPKGLRFCTQKELPTEPIFHNFACIKADGSRVDGSALTFYEPVEDPQICQTMQYMHTMHLRELTMSNNPKMTTASNSLTVNQGENVYLASKPPRTADRSTSKGGSNTLPRRGRSNKAKRTSFYDSSKDKLFVVKCICLLTRLPVVGACESVLRSLYQMATSQNLLVGPLLPVRDDQSATSSLHLDSAPSSNQHLLNSRLPLESYVYWLLYEVPLPPPGRSLKLNALCTDIICQRPGGRGFY